MKSKTNLSIFALDIGNTYIGLAHSPKQSFLASPLKAITYNNTSEIYPIIYHYLKEKKVDTLLVGYPYTLVEKKKSTQCEKVDEICDYLKPHLIKNKIKLMYVDERLSSWSTKKDYKHLKLKRGYNKKEVNIDSMVAMQFIETYIESISPSSFQELF